MVMHLAVNQKIASSSLAPRAMNLLTMNPKRYKVESNSGISVSEGDNKQSADL